MAVTSALGTSGDEDADAEAEVDSGMETPKFDIGEVPPPPDPMPPPGCPPQPPTPVEECAAELPPGMEFQFYCVDPPEGGTCETWAENFEEINTPRWSNMASDCVHFGGCESFEVEAIGCGPLPDSGDQCCFWFIVTPWLCPPEGRPFAVDGSQRLAGLVEGDGWVGDGPGVPLPPRYRAAIAATWAETARSEHASIASFSRFVLQLLACGAPASLVAAAQAALGEEIEHARLFFALASRFEGRALGPGPLDVHGALAGSGDFDEIVLATVREGCIAETLCAWRLALAAHSAHDPSLADALARVAEQETEHAALAWRFLAWALPRASASLRARVAATLDEPSRYAPCGPILAEEVPDAVWRAHGILPPSDQAAATRQAVRELVEPLARMLLGTHPVEGRTPPRAHSHDALS